MAKNVAALKPAQMVRIASKKTGQTEAVQVLQVTDSHADGESPLYLVLLKDNTCAYFTEAQLLK